MTLTFAHMGNLYIGVRALFSSLGIAVVVPPRPSKRTLSLGTQNSPEFACLPLKVNIGNYIEAFELGADTIIMAGGVGPCRFGYYGEVQREILKDLGYDFEMIILEPPQGRWMDLFRKIRRLVGKASFGEIIGAARLAWAKILAVDELEREANIARAYEVTKGATSRLLDSLLERIDTSMEIGKVGTLREEGIAALRSLPRDPERRPLKVALVGEIYVVLEPFVNLEIERTLGEMGVLVERSIYISDWIREHLVADIFRPWKKRRERERLKELARPYLCHFVGGHGLESVSHSVEYSKQGFDGIIQVAPFTCMPEIVAQSILPKVSRRLGLPIMSLIFDEHSANEGVLTRLEAFVDLMARRRQRVVREA